MRVIALLFAASVCWEHGIAFDPVFGPPIDPMQSAPKQDPPDCETIFLTADLLVWNSLEEGLEFAYTNSQTQTDQSLQSFEPRSKFAPAFRLGFGASLPNDRWTLAALYTFYRTDRRRSAVLDFDPSAVPGPGIIAVWTYPAAFSDLNIAARFLSVHNRWRLHASFLDLALGRECEVSPLFSLAPAFGVRSAWLHQLYTLLYQPGNFIAMDPNGQIRVLDCSIDMHCDSNNVGPFFGCVATWRIGTRWDFFSDLSGALLASHFRIGRGETDLFLNSSQAVQTQSIRLRSTHWTFLPEGQIALGLRFSDRFLCGARRIRYRISLAYEAQLWWKQNQLLRYIDTLNAFSAGAYVTPMQGDLWFHGIDFTLGLDF